MDADGTIVAISTLAGFAGIGIVRMSGPSAINIASQIFQPKSKKKITELSANVVHLGKITDGKKFIDEVLLTIMVAPRSYTREDVVEISCHGGIIPVKKTLELCVKYGASIAQPGEFTKRAYLNGRIDLSQAEAVCDIIKSKTEVALSCAMSQLNGVLSCEINKQKNELVDILSDVEAAIDYSEDELPTANKDDLLEKINNVTTNLKKIVSTFKTGKVFKDGVRTVIVGKPNVGKSSLLNMLVGQDRAIVTEIPGTTRDTIDETIDIYGIPLILTDTAGIRRHSQDIVEKIGIARSYEILKSADLVLFVIDSSSELCPEDFHIAELLASKKVILVLNKSDLPGVVGDTGKLKITSKVVSISASGNKGLEELKKVIYDSFIFDDINTSDFMLTNIRHKVLIEDAIKSLEVASTTVKDRLSEEFMAMDLRLALNSLGEITGDVPTEEILNRIFSNFCVGK